ncbi:Copper amine oxidase N-terminal domain-containing protein [Paenibacillus sp. UNC496MF]|uniref:copper amine oxidase N-terminal domain-containing protein n=1 Tax=Paenibacillus sp. UNC496MF TaxID=1502753 RepID=UPI0008EFF2C2|nr:copper amine oxidase N-terminal domain-containing protein [Paenibacillus sp. UNC496MF]SFJ48746.1 Copper amine oxidase N-terminal domain-containing protein [Paenibacillus sp. UNC496MF]
MHVRVLLALIVGFAVHAVFAGTADAQAEGQREIPIHLKIDPYYILYTQPSAPFVDADNRLLLPLRAYQDLMGGTVSYERSTKAATVTLLDHAFRITIASRTAIVDGNMITMDTTPVLKGGAMFLPIRFFLDRSGINYHWDHNLQLLHITDERVVKGEPFTDFEGNDSTSGHEDGALHLSSFVMTPHSLSITAHNRSGKDIPKGKSDIHPLVTFKNKGGFSTDAYTRPVYPELPEVKRGASVTVTQRFDLQNAAYIISVGRRAP